MSPSRSPVPSAGSGSDRPWRHDVFLSFNGDTRLKFTDNLHAALTQRGISTFRDDEELERGGSITQKLLEAIEMSRVSIVIFSKNYASSSWCLKELEKIVYLMKSKGLQTVLPVFYDVDPSHVRKQTGSFEKAFADHEAAYGKDSDKVRKWRKALREVANRSGWHLQDKHESIIIEDIVRKVFTEVTSDFPCHYQSLVGMDSRAGQLQDKLLGSSDEVFILGIPGMGGIGKTTLAKVVYDRIRGDFDGCSFLANISEISKKRGIVSLQEQLLHDILKDKKICIPDVHRGVSVIRKSLNSRKVIIVLDDISEIDQLEALAGNCHWFGSGSRVIVTTRDSHLLFEHGVGKLFYSEKLDDHEALHLFSLRAFEEDRPPELYLHLSHEVVKYAHGLPLALTVLGSFLFGRSTHEWKSTLERLETTPMEKITDTLKISFDGLPEKEKEIFLDVACFFKGEYKHRVMKIWNGCGFDPDIGLRVLQEKFLITIRDKVLWMHDLLQQMGWEIVRQESTSKLGRRSRLWLPEDVQYVLENDKGSDFVEGVVILNTEKVSSAGAAVMDVDAKAFKKMDRLRVLKLQNVNLCNDLEYLSSQLRYLDWHSYQGKSLPSGFQPNNLVELRLRHSLIVELYCGEKPLLQLKHLDLSHSKSLIYSPDFGLLPNLEEILLEGCVGLSQLHHSIGVLHKLEMLNLSGCTNLVELPRSICSLRSLKDLNLSGCSKLVKLPGALGQLLCLEELILGYTALKELPSSFKQLMNLKRFSLAGFRGQQGRTRCSFTSSSFQKGDHPHVSGFPLTTLSKFCRLENLDLSDCSLPEHETPIDLSSLSLLTKLDLRGNNFAHVPFDISQLKKLNFLLLGSCERLEALPKLPASTELVIANHCHSLQTLPDNVGIAPCTFSFVNCNKLFNCTSNGGADRLLKFLFRNLLLASFEPSLGRTFNLHVPGHRIPRWFACQSTGSTTTILLDSNWFNDSFKGFVICAVFQASNLALIPNYYQLDYDLRVNGQWRAPSTSFLMLKSDGTIDSMHLWISYVTRRQWAEYYSDLEGVCHQVQLRFYSYNATMEVINCGIHPVHVGAPKGPDDIPEICRSSSASAWLDILPSSF